MGNLADKRRLREQAGEKIHKGEAVITEKDEMMFIPFVQSGNPDEKRPWLYKGFYRMPDGEITMELKRIDGYMELKLGSIDNYKDYIHIAVEEFIKRIYNESPHEAETISIDKHETETDILKKEIIRLQIDAENSKKVVDKFKEISKSL